MYAAADVVVETPYKKSNKFIQRKDFPGFQEANLTHKIQ